MADEGRTDPGVPIAVSDRAANLLGKRGAELVRELENEVVVRVDVVRIQPTSFDCEIRFDTQIDSQADCIFWSKGVRIAIGHHNLDIVRGMEIAYFDGVVSLRQNTCSRQPDIKDYQRTISVHGLRQMNRAREPASDRQHFNQVQLPSPPPKSAVREQVERLLDRDGGLLSIPRYFRKECLRTLSRESDPFLANYFDQHLGLLEQHIEPLAQSESAGGDAAFRELATMMVDTPNIGTAALTLGFEQPEDADLTVWLRWAVEKHDEPATRLYCVGNFLAVPPCAEDVPSSVVDGAARALAVTSLVEFGRYLSVIAIVEPFLNLAPDAYRSDDALLSALRHSPLDEVQPLQRNLMADAWLRSLEAVPERAGHATILRNVLDRF